MSALFRQQIGSEYDPNCSAFEPHFSECHRPRSEAPFEILLEEQRNAVVILW